MLLIFGAEVNPINNHCQTPLDIAISGEMCNIVAMLISVGGKTGDALLNEEDGQDSVRQLEPFHQVCESVIPENYSGFLVVDSCYLSLYIQLRE